MRKHSKLLAGIFFVFSVAAHADPLSLDKVPDPLKPWVQWVLDGHEEARCPGLPAGAAVNGAQRPCSWPARLELNVEDRQGRFRQDWQVYKETWAPLPGDAKRWPQEVQVDGRPAAVVLREEAPRVRLAPGAHAVSGEFRWDSMPELIQIPPETGLVGLSIRGKRVGFPNRDEEGRLWLQKAAGKQEGEDRLAVVVHRKVTDEVPLLLSTDIELKVSGKNREVLLGKALPAGFIPMSLNGPLPARLDRDGRLRVQARPGDWRLELEARHEGPISQMSPPVNTGPGGGPWDNDEVWVYDARPDLRLASVEGVASVDPQQTELPQEWKQLPAYVMRSGDTMRLVERRRGDADPAPDQLDLARTWWLDFKGGGYSIKDRISGTLRRSWRMEMAEPTVLGRVAVAGSDQFITALAPKPGEPKTAGIEIRQGAVQLDADSRLERTWFRLPAVGWNLDFHQVRGQLNLPPGWRLIHAFGVDDASPTWVSRWTLFDIFILLIVALSVGRLWSRRWGWLAFAAFALCYHEPGAPRWVLVMLLAAEALARALPAGKVQQASTYCRAALRLALVLILVPFLITQVRVALHPQLESRNAYSGGGNLMNFISGPAAGLAMQAQISPLNEPMDEEAASEAPESAALDIGAGGGGGSIAGKAKAFGAVRGEMARAPLRMMHMRRARRPAPAAPAPNQMMNVYAPDPKALVSTGPGMPAWQWNSVSLSWRGPVKHSQRMWLVLVGPVGNFSLALIRVALLILLTLCLIGQPVEDWLMKLSARWRKPAVAAALLAAALAAAGQPARAEMPSPDVLQDLQKRLLRPADCEPDCASIPRLRIEATADTLRVRLEVSAGALTSLPLPGGAKQWTPSQVLLDGSPARGLLRSPEGLLYLPVSAGSHQVLLEGPLPDRESMELPLPLKPHRVEAQASGWSVEGLREDGVPEENLQFTRVRGSQRGPSDAPQGGNLPPFVNVERSLNLGLSWEAVTKVTRVTPPGAAVVLDVPLLPGESVTSPDVRVQKGKVKVSMGPRVTELEWTSVLPQSATLALKAPDSTAWTEVWRLDASPIWHVSAEGIPVIHSENAEGARLREWRPWPGETVDLAISRPEGVPGQTTTVDRSVLSASPGLRASDLTLELSLRSSRGGQHTLTLPEGAELQSLSIDGAAQPARQDKLDVTIPILPGAHQVSLAWRQGGGIGLFYRVPKVHVGLASVNSDVTVSVPADRWILAVWGPRLGPAVLFWSVLAVTLLLSFGLEKLNLAPLKTRDWFLLSIGLSQASIPVAALVVGWLLVLGVRKKTAVESPWRFDLIQAALTVWTVVALACLLEAIRHGLLGQPEMQISGNGSSAYLLKWYRDRVGQNLPRPGLFSLPRMFYRLAMLAWAMWIASSLLSWLKWGWSCANEGGLWKAVRRPKGAEPAAAQPSAPDPTR